MNTNYPKPNEPGLSRLDCEHLERLLKAGHLEIAAKLYRSACRCSAKQAKLEIEALSKIPIPD
jgi:hypothetical protein